VNTKFKVGDVVELKSGGPTMTVDGINFSYSDNDVLKHDPVGVASYSCKWFSGKKSEHGHFSEEALKVPDEDKK